MLRIETFYIRIKRTHTNEEIEKDLGWKSQVFVFEETNRFRTKNLRTGLNEVKTHEKEPGFCMRIFARISVEKSWFVLFYAKAINKSNYEIFFMYARIHEYICIYQGNRGCKYKCKSKRKKSEIKNNKIRDFIPSNFSDFLTICL